MRSVLQVSAQPTNWDMERHEGEGYEMVRDLPTRATSYLILLLKFKNAKIESKAIPLQAWTGPERSRR